MLFWFLCDFLTIQFPTMHLQGFYHYLQYEKRLSKHTYQAYKTDIDQFASFLGHQFTSTDTELLTVTHRQIRAWIVALMQNSISAKSVNRKISSLKTYYKFLIKNHIIEKNPTAKIISPKIPSTLPIFIDKKNLQQVFIWIDENYPHEHPLDLFVSARDKFILEILYGTGVRRSELLGLTTDKINLKSAQIKVIGKGNKERIIPIGKPVINAYIKYEELKNNIFGKTNILLLSVKGKPLNENALYKMIHQILGKTTTLHRKSPHVLRHTFATHLSDSGADLNAIKELLGHSSLASTQVYTHNTIEKLKKIHKQAHPKS